MVLDTLASSLRNTLKKIANATHIDKNLIKEVIRDIQRALIQADVNVKMVISLTNAVEERALTEKPPSGMSSREHVIRIIYDELVKILGNAKEVPLKKHTIMMVGLYGNGKTTTCGKLAKFFQKRGLKTGLLAGDTHRPAAFDQLQQLAKKVNVAFYGEPKTKNALKVVKAGLKELKNLDVIIIDTSGRHALEKDLIKEIESISRLAKPDEKFLVIDAAVGQQAGPQAKAFHQAVGVTGVILTKLDGSAKGGGALSAVSETKAPIVYVGTGEHLEDLERFDPPRFISRLLGMGDLQTLLEKVQDVTDAELAEDTARKIMSGKFTLHDMYDQMRTLSDMGPLQKIMNLLPFNMTGGAKLPTGSLEDTQEKLKKFRIIMDSMTEQEMNNPQIIKTSRVQRIARGSGCDVKDVKALLKYYNMSRKAIKGFTSNRKIRKKLMQQLKFSDGMA
ncbi:signal recognition particle protein Srp54 [[Eubacterium] cellulosolvens]